MNRANAKSGPSLRPVSSDVWGGLAAMLVAFPSAIAFGVLVYAPLGSAYGGVGAIAGILGAVVLGVTAPLVGRNPGFITAPCAPAAAVLSGLATRLASGGTVRPEQAIGLIALATLLSALLQILFGAVRAGRLIKFIPYQVVSGYLSGVAVIIAVGQLPKLLGVPSKTPFLTAISSPDSWRWPGIVVGIVTIAVALTAPRLTTKVPAAILGLAAGITTYFALALFRSDLLVVGNPLVIGPLQAKGSVLDVAVGRAHSLLSIQPSAIASVAGTALTLSVLLSIDTLKTGVVLDALTKRRHDSNRELIAQGAANAASFLAGGMAGAGTMGATLVNVTSGGKTIWSSVLAGVLSLIVFVALGGFVAWVPIAALAGILLVVAYRMFDFKMFRLLKHRSTLLDFAIIAAVVVVAEGVGLIEASAVGVGLAILLFIRAQIRSEVLRSKRDLRTVRSKRRRSDADNEVLGRIGEQAVFVELQDDLFFGTTDKLLTQLDETLSQARYLLLDLRRVDSVDFTALHLFEQMRQRLQERKGSLLLCGMPSNKATAESIEEVIEQHGLAKAAGVKIFETRDAALEWMENSLLDLEGRQTIEVRAALPLDAIPLLTGLRPEVLKELEKVVRTRTLREGEKIFARGDAGDEMFFVRTGRIHVLLPLPGGRRHHLATFCEGESFGELAFLDGDPRSADAEAATDSSVYVLMRHDFDALAREHADVAVAVFECLAKLASHRLRQTDTELRAIEDR